MRFPAINAGRSLTPEEIDSYATGNSLRLPTALRQQLLDQNGGAPVNDVFVDVDGREEELMSFFGINMGDEAGELAWVASTFVGRLPDGVLAFADDPAGNLFVIETGGSSRVWFWDHELEGDPTALSPVAESLAVFMESLDLGEA